MSSKSSNIKSKESLPILFYPVNILGLSLKNRIVFGAHISNMSEESLPGEKHFFSIEKEQLEVQQL